LKELFLAALDGAPEGRAAWLERECPDGDRRQQLNLMLAAHDAPQSLFDRPPAVALTSSSSQDEGQLSTLDAEITGPNSVIGPYKLLEQIGEGGFGVVFMAEQQRPVRRRVALKVLKPGMDTRQVVVRFEAERQALALMDHPNIAKVHDGGSTDTGRPYFVMELVRGVPVTEFCDRNHLSVRQRLELFISVCQAVQHAHQKGVIHRDLKPSNVLVTLHDGVPVAKVIDFGVAKAMGQQLTERTLFTNFAQMIGTPLYMSPEQAEMSGLDVDTRTDIYALGVLLYELLTGTTPLDRERFKTAGYDEIRRIIREQEPARPSTRVSTLGAAATTISASRQIDPAGLSRLFRGELDWIVMKCLEKDRNRRYETAASLVADVQRYLKDEPVQACPPSTWYRFRKFARRNKRAVVTATAAALVVLAAVAGLATSNFLIMRAQWDTAKALDDANGAREDLKQTKDLHRVDAYFGRIALAYRELSADNLGGALKLLDDCPEDLRGWEWYFLKRLCRVEPIILPDKTEVNSLAFSPDGEYIAAACGDGAVKVWNIKTRKVVQPLLDAHPDAVFSVAIHPHGKHLASVGSDQRVKVWDLSTDPAEKVFERPCYAVHDNGTAYTVAFSPGDGRQLAAGIDDAVKVWDWRTGRNDKPLHIFAGHPKPRSISVAYSRDGQRLASGSMPGSLKLWDPEAGGEPLRTFLESPGVVALSFSPDGGRLATASFSRRADVWDTTTGEHLHELRHSGLVLGVAFSADGRRLASAGEDKTVHIWDAATGREVLGLRGHNTMCGCVAFSPDGWRLASASKDGTIRIWDATPLRGDEGQETLTFTHGEEVWSVAVSPDGQKIASAGFGSPVKVPVKVWEAQTKQVSYEFSEHLGIVFCVAWHPDGKWIASAGQVGEQLTIKVWDAQTGLQVFPLPRGPEEYLAVAFSPDGKYLVTGNAHGKLQVWDARNGSPVGTLGTHDRKMRVRGVAFSHDGLHLASAGTGGDGKVYLWDATRLEEKQEGRTLNAQNRGNGLTVAFSPDGRRLVTGGEKHTAKIWDVETGRKLITLEGHNGDVCAVAFSPDPGGRWVASAGEDSTVKVWDSHTGELLKSFRGHTALVGTLAFLDGQTLISGSRDHTIKFWDLKQLEEAPDR
jgi:WD40 repeat protein/serine/threonine protein kinase